MNVNASTSWRAKPRRSRHGGNGVRQRSRVAGPLTSPPDAWKDRSSTSDVGRVSSQAMLEDLLRKLLLCVDRA
jgi:hypothetical protein